LLSVLWGCTFGFRVENIFHRSEKYVSYMKKEKENLDHIEALMILLINACFNRNFLINTSFNRICDVRKIAQVYPYNFVIMRDKLIKNNHKDINSVSFKQDR